MVSETNERAFERAIERALTGTTTEDLRAGVTTEDKGKGYVIGSPDDFNKDFALDTKLFWQFLESTQTEALSLIKKDSPHDWERKVYERFDKVVKREGILEVLRKGLSFGDITFDLLHSLPVASSGERIRLKFEQNIFSCTRQLRYSNKHPGQEIDLVLFVNGIPLITLELKNAWTNQTARYHGQKQYREDRDHHQPLLQFARCLVHMAVDTDEVYMTTKLAGGSTIFLPFNQGNEGGQGNPPNPTGHRTAYLWEEVFTRESLTNLIEHFIKLSGKKRDPLKKKTLYFPRYHQLDVVRRLVDHCSAHGVGHKYLIQHSAGSGKSNSISWAAFQLIDIYPTTTEVAGGRDLERPLFDSVIVVTDRRLLDKQIKENITSFTNNEDIVAHAERSADLREALVEGKRIIITTIQKFPFILEGVDALSDKHFAIIIDEAHSSQSGSAHTSMNSVVGKVEEEEEDQSETFIDQTYRLIEARKMQRNASYFAFTATPKNSTLEKFGVQRADGSFHPFHLYSMKQAIEEGFILDVLTNYTTYKSFYEVLKSTEENPQFQTAKAQAYLKAYVEQSAFPIHEKAEVMLKHFMEHVYGKKKLRGQAKGMVVTQRIESAIRYYLALKELLSQRGNPFKVLIAFSGKKLVDGVEYTEEQLNGFPDAKTAEKFDEDEYRLLIVANKYLTGFDQPKLCAMYLDKKLAGVLCVQALSRLNRSAPKLNKRSEDLFVLDFYNSTTDIQNAFNPYYTATSLSEATDINVLNDLKSAMDEYRIYQWSEVEQFNERFFKGEDAQTLSPLLDRAAQRFTTELELEHEDRADFKIKAKQFVKIYSQMASIMARPRLEWELLFWFSKFLIPKLTLRDPIKDDLDLLLASVDLTSYGLSRDKLSESIELESDETVLDPQNPNPRSAHEEEEKAFLDQIVETFNERWFQGWGATPEEQRIKFINIAKSIREHPDFQRKYLEDPDPHNRALAFEKLIKEVMLQRRRDEIELYKLFAQDADFKSSWIHSIMQRVVDSSTLMVGG